jgi:hypothetical protein
MDYGFSFVVDPPGKLATAFAANNFLRLREETTPIAGNFTNIQALFNALENSSSVVRPIDDILIVGHAGHLGLQIPLVPGQTTRTEYETIVNAGTAIQLPIGVVGNTGSFLHIRGCNLGKDVAFLNKMKSAIGFVDVTAPVHFDGFNYQSDSGAFEFMCYEFYFTSPFQLGPKPILNGFIAKKNALAAANPATPWTFIDGSPVQDSDLTRWVDKGVEFSTAPAFPLGVSVGVGKKPRQTIRANTQLRIQRQKYWVTTPFASPSAVPTDPDARQAAFENKLNADPIFQSTYASPVYLRYGYNSINEFINGFTNSPTQNLKVTPPTGVTGGQWFHQRQGSTLVSTGYRWEYTIVQPITQSKDPTSNIVFNFYPNHSTDTIVLQIDTTDTTFFASTKT